MSDPVKVKSYWQTKRRKIANAVAAFLADASHEDNRPFVKADALVDHLGDAGLQIVPSAAQVYGKWRVLVDGQAANWPGKDGPGFPLDADETAEVLLLALIEAEEDRVDRVVTVRPASNEELVRTAVASDPAVVNDPIRVVGDMFVVQEDAGTGALLLRIIGDGQEVMVGLDDETRSMLREVLATEEEEDAL